MSADLTPVEQRAFDLMEPGEWYGETSLNGGKELPYTIRRRAHVLECLRTKGYLESEVHFAIPGSFYSTYRLYCKVVKGAKSARPAKSVDSRERKAKKWSK